jgi:hypothetical protein
MKNLIVVGDFRTGHDAYSQRTDEFGKILDSKLAQITSLAIAHKSEILLLNGIREKTSEIGMIPILLKHFYGVKTHYASICRRSPFIDILEAANCVTAAKPEDIEVISDITDLPLRLIAGKVAGWILYQGPAENLAPMAELIDNAVASGGLNGIICLKGKSDTQLPGVMVVNPLVRTKENSDIPNVIVVNDDSATSHSLKIDPNVFFYENASSDNIEENGAESDFVRRLKAETLETHPDQEMDSEKNLRQMIEETYKKVNVSDAGKAIIQNLLNQTT